MLFFFNLSPFHGATDTPVLDFWWHLPWVSKLGWIPCLCASLPVCNGFLRFTSGVTPADCMEVSMAAKPFQSTYLQTCLQALVVEVWPGTRAHNHPCCTLQACRCKPLGHSGSAFHDCNWEEYELVFGLKSAIWKLWAEMHYRNLLKLSLIHAYVRSLALNSIRYGFHLNQILTTITAGTWYKTSTCLPLLLKIITQFQTGWIEVYQVPLAGKGKFPHCNQIKIQ